LVHTTNLDAENVSDKTTFANRNEKDTKLQIGLYKYKETIK